MAGLQGSGVGGGYVSPNNSQLAQQRPGGAPTADHNVDLIAQSRAAQAAFNATLPQGPPVVSSGVEPPPGPSSAPVGGLISAAPVGAMPTGNVAPGASQAAATAMSQSPDDSDGNSLMSGPSVLRQGIGQRNPPDRTPMLNGLRNIY